MPIETLQFLTIESSPFNEHTQDLQAEYHDLPEVFLNEVQRLIDQPEDATCVQCSAGIGYVLVETSYGEDLRWKWTVIVAQNNHAVFSLCEDCSAPVCQP